MDRIPVVLPRPRTRGLVAAGLGVALIVGLAPAAQAAEDGPAGSDWPSIAAAPTPGDITFVPPLSALRRASGLQALDSDYLVWDEHTDPVGDTTLDPELTGAFMGVQADDPTTAGNESSVLVIGALTSDTTVDTDVAVVFLDVDGDSTKDVAISTPSGSIPLDEPVEAAISTSVGGSFTESGERAVWLRENEGYLVALDFHALGLTAARFTFGLSDTSEGTVIDLAPDDITGAPVELPSAVPSAPQNVIANPGDGRVKVVWTPPANSGSNPITSYTVTSYPDGRSCTTSGLTCVVTGLTNQQSYTFGVVAVSASGTSAPTTSDAVIPQPFTKVIVRAKRSGRVLHVNVNPNLTGSKYWRFRVIRITAKGTWVSKRAFRTRGAGETRTIDMPKGRYWVVVLPKYGYQATVSRAVTLRR